jgi:hypothetical protein
MGGPRMNTLTECARHGAAIRVICKRCGNERYFDPSELKVWLKRGDPDIAVLRFVCRCGSRRVHSFAQRGVPRHMRSPLPTRPQRHDDWDRL